MLQIYGAEQTDENRYSPAVCLGCEKRNSPATPIRNASARRTSSARISRCGCPCAVFTRLTNSFSKKLENHTAAVALHYMHYNFARILKTLRVTPAMQAGLSDHVWGIEEIVGLTDLPR